MAKQLLSGGELAGWRNNSNLSVSIKILIVSLTRLKHVSICSTCSTEGFTLSRSTFLRPSGGLRRLESEWDDQQNGFSHPTDN